MRLEADAVELVNVWHVQKNGKSQAHSVLPSAPPQVLPLPSTSPFHSLPSKLTHPPARRLPLRPYLPLLLPFVPDQSPVYSSHQRYLTNYCNTRYSGACECLACMYTRSRSHKLIQFSHLLLLKSFLPPSTFIFHPLPFQNHPLPCSTSPSPTVLPLLLPFVPDQTPVYSSHQRYLTNYYNTRLPTVFWAINTLLAQLVLVA